MTAPQPPAMQIDAERLVQRAAAAMGQAQAGLAGRLALAEEMRDLYDAHNAELRAQLEQKTAELARLAQTVEQLQAAAGATEQKGASGDTPDDA